MGYWSWKLILEYGSFLCLSISSFWIFSEPLLIWLSYSSYLPLPSVPQSTLQSLLRVSASSYFKHVQNFRLSQKILSLLTRPKYRDNNNKKYSWVQLIFSSLATVNSFLAKHSLVSVQSALNGGRQRSLLSQQGHLGGRCSGWGWFS